MNYDFNPFEVHKALLFSGSKYSDGNFFDYFCKDTIGDHSMAKYHREMYSELYSYDFQKFIIEKFPDNIKEFIEKVRIINDDIKKEYDYIFDSDDLGLL